MSTGAWRRGRLVAGSGRQCRTCDLWAGVVADRILNGSILPLCQVSCVQAAWSWPNSFPGSGISPPICTCGLRSRSRVILATGVKWPVVSYLSRPQRREREIFESERERF